MKEIIFREKEELNIKKNMGKFLEYIDVSQKTIKTYEIALKQFGEYLCQNNIITPTRENIIAYREHIASYLKPTSVNSYLIAVRNFYKWLEYEEITKDITKNIKGIKLEERHLKRGLSEEEIKLVLDNCKDIREELLIKLMISCALRVNEVVNIRLNDFYQEQGVTMLNILGKGRGGIKQDRVKIDQRILEIMKQYINEYNIKDYLFTSTSNNKKEQLTTKTIRLIVTNIFKRSGLDMNRLSSHSTRHTSCEILLQKGVPIQEVSQFLRHKSLSTVMIYAKELNQRTSKSANILSDQFF